MRARAECRVKRELKENYAETTLDPETIKDVRSRRGVKFKLYKMESDLHVG